MQNHVQDRGAWFRDGGQELVCRTMCKRGEHGIEMVSRSWYAEPCVREGSMV
jgi:hypothetical protein